LTKNLKTSLISYNTFVFFNLCNMNFWKSYNSMNLLFTDSIGFLESTPLQKLFLKFSKIQSYMPSFSTLKSIGPETTCEKLTFTNNILITIDDNRNILYFAPYFKSF
jgi:hypothetical protein